MSNILAIDQSTSATKAILFGEDDTIIGKAVVEHRQIYPKPGWVEHDGEEIWANALSAIRTVVERNTSALKETLCLSITNQRETVLAFDLKTGKPLANAIVWQCRRGDEICAALRGEGHDELVHSKTGLKIDSYFSGSKMRWIRENITGLAERLDGGSALFGTIDTYLIYRFKQGAVFATDSTNASRTLLFDLGRLAWDEELCELFKVPRAALAEVRDSAAHFGETTLDGLLDRPIPICGVVGDSQASLFGQRCLRPGAAKVTLGTGSSLLLNVGGTMPEGEGSAMTSLAWVHEGKPTYAGRHHQLLCGDHSLVAGSTWDNQRAGGNGSDGAKSG